MGFVGGHVFEYVQINKKFRSDAFHVRDRSLLISTRKRVAFFYCTKLFIKFYLEFQVEKDRINPLTLSHF